MTQWLVSVPVWGEAYHKVFAEYGFPSIKAALEGFKQDVKFIIHTDRPTQIKILMSGYEVETREISNKPLYTTLQESHADVIKTAQIGERVCLLNADLVLSGNVFEACENHIDNNKFAIVLSGIRTQLPKIGGPPIGAHPRKLLKWAWDNRHQIIKDLEWGSGTSMLPTNIFFVGKSSVVMRGFHLHPIVIRKHKNINIHSTIDGDLLDWYEKTQIHVVTSPDDIAMLEISSPDRRFPIGRPLTEQAIAASMRTRANIMHRWLFTHRIVVVGNGDDVSDMAITRKIFHHMNVKFP